MAIGDDAAADGMDLVPANGATGSPGKVKQGWQEINRTRDYIAQKVTAAKAWVTANFLTSSEAAAAGVATASKLVRYKSNTRVTVSSPIEITDAVNKQYCDANEFDGGTVSGQILVPNAYGASSGYTVSYINSDGRISKGVSSERYKENIALLDPATLGEIFPDLYSFRMIGGDGSQRVGWIAERLAEHPDLLPFVVFATEPVMEEVDGREVATTRLRVDEDGNPVPESIDFISLMQAQLASLDARLRVLEG